MFIGILGFLAFGVGIIWLIASVFTKKGFKKPLITIGVGFVMFIFGAVTDPSEEEVAGDSSEKTSEVTKDTSKEDSAKEAESKKKDEDEKKAKAESESIVAAEEAKAESESIAAEEAAEAEEKDPASYRTDITYDQLARTPDDYFFEKITLSGKVVQVIEGDSTTNNLRVAVNDNYDTIVLVEYEKDILDSRILEDDYINIYGYYYGVTTYESTMGGNISVPTMLASMITY